MDERSLKLAIKGGLHADAEGVMLKFVETLLTETTSTKLTVVSHEAKLVVTFIERS